PRSRPRSWPRRTARSIGPSAAARVMTATACARRGRRRDADQIRSMVVPGEGRSCLDFGLSEEQQLLKKTVRDFAESELLPHVREWDEKQEFPRDVFTRLGALGLMGVVWPAEYGGSGLTTLDYAIVMEELSRVDAGVALP